MADRPDRHPQVRVGAPLDHHRLGVSAGHPQPGDGTLHAVYRRADRHWLHAHATRCGVLGLDLRDPLVLPVRLARLGAGERHGLHGTAARTHPGGRRRAAGDRARLRRPSASASRSSRSANASSARSSTRCGSMVAAIILYLVLVDVFTVSRRELAARAASASAASASCRKAATGCCSARSPPIPGSGGIGNAYTTNWMRDKGYGMGATVGYIPSVMADAVPLPPHGNIFPITPQVPRRLARVVALRSPRPVGDLRLRIVRRHGAGGAVHRAIRAGRHRGG